MTEGLNHRSLKASPQILVASVPYWLKAYFNVCRCSVNMAFSQTMLTNPPVPVALPQATVS